MKIIIGVVIDLMIWYVPTVFDCRDKFVSTTKPQNDSDNGNMCRNGSALYVNRPKNRQITMPTVVNTKCTHVSVMLGKCTWVKTTLFSRISEMDSMTLMTKQKLIYTDEYVCPADSAVVRDIVAVLVNSQAERRQEKLSRQEIQHLIRLSSCTEPSTIPPQSRKCTNSITDDDNEDLHQ